MKTFKYVSRMIVALFACIVFAFACVACDEEEPVTLKALSPPQNLTIVGDVLFWDEVEGAVGYQIYADGELIGETTETTYTLTHKNAEKESIKCKALGDNVNNKDSFFSFEVTRSAYVEPVVVEHKLDEQGCTVEVASEVTYVKIVGTAGKWYNDFEVKILSRETDLKIELVDVHAVGKSCLSTIFNEEYQYSNVTKGCNVYLISEGEGNSLQGGFGYNGSNGDKGSFMVSGEDGSNGGTGATAIAVENLIICGKADLAIIGGKGGNGGKGGDGGDFIVGSGSTAGSGGNGGSGGDGIQANSIYLNADKDMTLTIIGGDGGSGGKCGSSNLGAGIVYFDGSAGGVGKKHSGTITVLSGIYK